MMRGSKASEIYFGVKVEMATFLWGYKPPVSAAHWEWVAPLLAKAARRSKLENETIEI